MALFVRDLKWSSTIYQRYVSNYPLINRHSFKPVHDSAATIQLLRGETTQRWNEPKTYI